MEKNSVQPESELRTSWTLIRKLSKPNCDEETWLQFYNIYQKFILGVAAKAGLDREESKDALQEIMRTVSSNIRKFEPNQERGSFKAWLMKTARWRIIDQFKRRQKHLNKLQILENSEYEHHIAAIEGIPDPNSLDSDLIWENEWKRELLNLALKRVSAKLSPEQFQIFDFYNQRQMPVAEIVLSLGVSAARVYLTSHRVLKLVQKEALALEKTFG